MVFLFNTKNDLGNMLAIIICVLFIFLLYLGVYIPHIFILSPMTKRLKQFSNTIIFLNGYGIIFIILALSLFPHTYISVFAYFYFVAIIVAGVGYLIDK